MSISLSHALKVSVIVAVILFSANAFAATIDLGGVINNPGFELGNQVSGCPTAWTCGGSPAPGFTSYTVTNTQYHAGSDGLTGGLIVPGGTQAAYSPTLVEGSGTLYQGNLGTYTFGNTYTLNLWVGTPLVDLAGNANGIAQTIRAYFLYGGSNQAEAVDLTAPAVGQWALNTISFTPTGNDPSLGQSVALELFVDSGQNDQVTNFDIVPPSAVPLPPAAPLFASAMIALAALGLYRRKNSASV